MKKLQYYFVGLVIVISSLASSCKTKDDPQPTPKSKAELLNQKSWVWNTYETREASGWIFQNLSANTKDNVWTFNVGGTYSVKDNATVSAPTIMSGTWSINATGQFVKDGEAFVINTLDENTFIFSGIGMNDDERYTFKH